MKFLIIIFQYFTLQNLTQFKIKNLLSINQLNFLLLLSLLLLLLLIE